MSSASKSLRKSIGKCQNCGYNKYPEILTAHHLYKKSLYKRQPPLPRRKRYLLLCPNCHTLEHLKEQTKVDCDVREGIENGNNKT